MRPADVAERPHGVAVCVGITRPARRSMKLGVRERCRADDRGVDPRHVVPTPLPLPGLGLRRRADHGDIVEARTELQVRGLYSPRPLRRERVVGAPFVDYALVAFRA